MRRPIIAANWKMNKTSAEAVSFIDEFIPLLANPGAEVVICPPFTSLEAVSARLAPTEHRTGAQDVYWEARGAFTGEVSPEMVARAGAHYCIIGHSERRKLFGESDIEVGHKATAVLAAGLDPIICVGETLEERKDDRTSEVVIRQVTAAIRGVSPDKAARLVIAYEPVWAIGTGVAATPSDAFSVADTIRQLLEDTLGEGAGGVVRVQYGGSVKADNISDFMSTGQIDGALVGGASLEPRGFAALVNECLRGRMK